MVVVEHALDSRGISAGIACYVCQPHVNPFDLKRFNFAATAHHIAVVDIASHGTYHRHHLFETAYYADVAHVAGVPYLIAIFEVGGVAVVPT